MMPRVLTRALPGCLFFAVALFLFFAGYRLGLSLTWASIIALVLGMLGAGLVIWGYIFLSAGRGEFQFRVFRQAYERVSEAIDELDPTELKTIIRLNREQMDQYHTLTKSQAADAYKRAQRAMLGGFAILVIGAIVTLQQDSPEATIAGGGLTGLGAVLAGYIGKTFLDVYRRALAQLNFYFEQPLVSSYLITAERLTQNVSEQRKDDALLKIVDRILTATISRSSLPLSQSDSAQWPSNEPGKAVEE